MKREYVRGHSKHSFEDIFEDGISNIESFKRRRALHSFWSLDLSSKLFFERVLHVKRGSEVVFVTKSQGRGR